MLRSEPRFDRTVGALFPDSEMFIIHINSNTVTFNKFTVSRFQQRGQKYELEPDAIIYRDGDYIYCFVNSLLRDRSYIMHGQIFKSDPLTLDVKYSDQVFDGQNWGWFPQSVGQDINGRELIKHWSSDGQPLGSWGLRDQG